MRDGDTALAILNHGRDAAMDGPPRRRRVRAARAAPKRPDRMARTAPPPACLRRRPDASVRNRCRYRCGRLPASRPVRRDRETVAPGKLVLGTGAPFDRQVGASGARVRGIAPAATLLADCRQTGGSPRRRRATAWHGMRGMPSLTQAAMAAQPAPGRNRRHACRAFRWQGGKKVEWQAPARPQPRGIQAGWRHTRRRWNRIRAEFPAVRGPGPVSSSRSRPVEAIERARARSARPAARSATRSKFPDTRRAGTPAREWRR